MRFVAWLLPLWLTGCVTPAADEVPSPPPHAMAGHRSTLEAVKRRQPVAPTLEGGLPPGFGPGSADD